MSLWLVLAFGAVVAAGVATRGSNIDAMCPSMVHQVFENYVPFGRWWVGGWSVTLGRQIDIIFTLSSNSLLFVLTIVLLFVKGMNHRVEEYCHFFNLNGSNVLLRHLCVTILSHHSTIP